MSRSIFPRDLVAHRLAVSPRVLFRYERLGLIQVCQEGEVEGYEPAQIRRLGRILSLQRDLGINLAGIEVILKLHDQMLELHRRLDSLASDLGELLDDPDPLHPNNHRSGSHA